MPRQVFDYDPPDRFVAGTVGEPGSRTFFLQARSGTQVTSVALEKAQVAKLNKLRGSRDAAAVEASLKTLRAASEDGKTDLMPPILDAVRAYATLGEICGVMREVFGEYRALAIV